MKALVLGYGRSGKAAEALLKAQGLHRKSTKAENI